MTLYCYRHWARDRVLVGQVITIHEGTALCLPCVDEVREQAAAEVQAMQERFVKARERLLSRRQETLLEPTVGDLLAGRWTRAQRLAHRSNEGER